jgi:hypothetical protein
MALLKKTIVDDNATVTHSADVSRFPEHKTKKHGKTVRGHDYAATERKNVKIDPPDFQRLKVAANMLDKKSYNLLSEAINEYIQRHFEQTDIDLINRSIER